MALGDSAIFVSLIRLQADWFRRDEFATLSGLSLFVAGIGFWLTTVPLSWALGHWPWQAVYAGVGGAVVLVAVLAYAVIPRTRPQAEASSDVRAGAPTMLRDLFAILRNRRSWPTMLVFMALYSIWTVFGATWGIPYWHRVQHLTLGAAALRFTVFVAFFAIGSWTLGRLSDRWRSRRPMQLYAGGLAAPCWPWRSSRICPRAPPSPPSPSPAWRPA